MGFSGSKYVVSYTKPLSTGSYLTVAITTPAATSGRIVLRAVCEVSSAGTFTFAESSLSGGSALTPVDTNLASSATAPATVAGTPTITTYGTVIETRIRGAAPSPIWLGGNDQAEYTLNASKSYTLNYLATLGTVQSAITLYFYKV